MPLCDALWAVWVTLLSPAHILMAEQENPENYSDEKLLALAIADIKAKRSAFYESGEPFTLPKEEFERQWMGADGWYTFANRRGTKSYYNCRLNQTRNYAIANKKPDDYVNPSGRELSFQKHYCCNSSLTEEDWHTTNLHAEEDWHTTNLHRVS